MIELLTPTKAAEILCLSELTLRKWRWEGKGPRYIKIGRKVAYKKEDLSNWIDSQSRTSTSDSGEIQ